MTTDKDLIDTFIALTKGTLNETEWLQWFGENKELVEKTCGRTAFLKIKPVGNLSPIGNTYAGQTEVFNWLKAKNIDTVLNDIYKKAYKKEFDLFLQQEKQNDRECRRYFKDNFSYLEENYPRFFRQLQKEFDTSNIIEKGKTQSEISQKEIALSISFSPELITFFSAVSKLQLEGITIDFDELSIETFDKKPFLILGEFWYYGDGDLLLYDPENHHLFSYAHEYRPSKIIKLASGMVDLLEKNFYKYLKQLAD